MSIAIYIRVSTEEQAEHGHSIDVQKERLIAYCASQGWDDYKLYLDDGYTGTNMERPALKRMIRHIEEKKVNGVLVMKLDRLSRKQKECLYMIEDIFEKNNVFFTSSSEKFDTSTAFGKAMIGVLAVFAQLERDMIVERTTAGRRENVRKGNWYGGRVPFGYAWNNQLLEVLADEAHVIKEIYKQYLQGQSRLAIAEWAAERTTARVFDHSVVRDMLSRPVYMGKLMNAGVLENGNHEAIIDEETWYAVQREVSRRQGGVSAIGEYLLTGLLACGVCGGNVVHVKRKTTRGDKSYLYELYACKNQHVRAKERNNNCSLGYRRRTNVESFVIDRIKSLAVSPKEIAEIINKKSEHKDDIEIVNALQEKLVKVNAGLDNLYDAIQSGEIKASRVGERIKQLEEERENIESQVDEFVGDIPRPRETKEIISFVQEIGKAWEYFDSDEQKATLRKVIKSITLYKDSDPIIDWNLD